MHSIVIVVVFPKLRKVPPYLVGFKQYRPPGSFKVGDRQLNTFSYSWKGMIWFLLNMVQNCFTFNIWYVCKCSKLPNGHILLQSKIVCVCSGSPVDTASYIWRYLIHICWASSQITNCKSTLPQFGVGVYGEDQVIYIKIHVIYSFQWLKFVNVTECQLEKLLAIGDGLADTS